MVSDKITMEVNSSMRLFSDLFVKWREVIINKQNPRRLAEVERMC